MVNRPDSSSTRSTNSSKSMSNKHFLKNSSGSNGGIFVRSKSGNDYNGIGQNKLRNSSSLQSIAKSGDKGNRNGLKKYKSNSR